jgi:hypothetical protein
MTDDEIILQLRAAGAGRSATELAELLDKLTGGGLSQGTLITYFQRSFPTVPLWVLQNAGMWRRVSGGPMSDAELNELLRPWLP